MPVDLSQISALRIREHVQKLSEIGPREDGTVADHKAGDYVAGALRALGLEVKREPVPCWVIEPIQVSLKMLGPETRAIECGYGNLTGITGPQGVQGELAFVNKGFEEDYEGRDVRGKVAIAWQELYWEHGDQPRAKMKRAAAHGAVALIFVMQRRDRLITCWGLDREPGPIPFITISHPDFVEIRALMKNGPARVAITAAGEPRRSSSDNIWAVLKGTELPDELIGLGSCHHETVPLCPGANDNGSGIAWLLELARFFTANPQKRSILFFINGGEEGGLWGARAFVDAHKDWLTRSLKAMLMVDQIGGMDPMAYMGGARWLEQMWVDEANSLGYRMIECFDPIILPEPGSLGDGLPFVQAGIPTAVTGAWPSDFFYHTVQDLPDKVSANGVKAVADSAASLVGKLASR